MVLVANPKISANSVKELIAYAKAYPNKLNYAEIGIGSAMHMGMEQFKFMTRPTSTACPIAELLRRFPTWSQVMSI